MPFCPYIGEQYDNSFTASLVISSYIDMWTYSFNQASVQTLGIINSRIDSTDPFLMQIDVTNAPDSTLNTWL